jgi:hypothetical protein
MTQSPSTDEQHGQQQANDCRRGVVTGGVASPKVSAKPLAEADLPEEAPEELQTGERGEPWLVESEGQITVDTEVKILFLLSHRLWPFVWRWFCLATSSYQTERPYFKGKGGLAVCGPPFSMLGLLSHQG